MNEGLRRTARLVLVILLALGGFWRVGVAVLSQLDDKLLWFDDEAVVGDAKEALAEPVTRMLKLCRQVDGHEHLVLDPQSHKDLGILCNRLHDARSGDSHQLLFYLTWHKLKFADLMQKVTEQQTDVDLMAAGMEMRVLECSLLSPLEDVRSVDSSARVSDVLLGLAALSTALWGYLRWRRSGAAAPETSVA
ncbi:MAG: hypothetical protein FJ098_06475 [Deltaproteobacteria bacterium]|nr:hypothetical protein [Deltaproteobacteria bacterium]